MCDPLSLAGLAISAVSTGVGFVGQMQQAKTQDATYRQNEINARAANANSQLQINERISQEREATASQKFENDLQLRRARATNLAAAGEYGVSGLSLEGLLHDITTKGQRYDTNVDTNLQWTTAQLESQKRGADYQTLDRINSVKPGQPPSLLAAGLKIASAGVNSYAHSIDPRSGSYSGGMLASG